MTDFTVCKPVRAEVGASEFKHHFGGKPIHQLTFSGDPPKKDLVVHCFYILDTEDPLLPNVVSDRRWLPLYYPMLGDCCDFAYQVVSDEVICIHEHHGDLGYDGSPYDGIPLVLPRHSVRLVPVEYEIQKIHIFGIYARYHKTYLSDEDITKLNESGHPFTQIGGIQDLQQGNPMPLCRNPDCDNGVEEVFATVWNTPVPDFEMWGDPYGEVVFQICRSCGTIHVCQQCT